MKRLPKENEYQLDIKDQFKNEFEIGQLQGNNFHMTDSADLPMLIEPQGNIEQEVIEAVEGIVVEGSSISVNDVDTSYEDSIMAQGNIEQVVVEEIPGNTIEGEIINITNGDSTKEVKAIVNGNSYQDTRVGYNYIDLREFSDITTHGVTITNNNDGTLTVNGTATNNATFVLKRRFDFPFGEETTLILEKEGTINGSYQLGFNEYNSDGDWVKNFAMLKNSTILNISSNAALENETNRLSLIFYVNSGTVLTNFKLKPMFVKGTYTESTKPPFEQYGSKPSKDFPSDIEVIDTVNMFDGELELGNIENGVNVPHTDVFRSKNYIKVKPNTQYAFSFNGVLNKVIICMYDKDKNYIGLDEVGLQVTNGLFTTYANAHYLRFRSYGADVVIVQTAKIQLNEGITVKPYLPYGTIGLLQKGKNELNLNANNINNTNIQTIIDTEKGTITINGINKTGGMQIPLSKDVLDIELNTPYTITIEPISGKATSNGNTWLFLLYPYSSSKSVQLFSNAKKSSTLTWTEKSNVVPYIWLGFNNDIGGYTTFENAVYRFQIEKGEVATPYEQHKSNLIPIDLQGNTLAKVGDIKDLLNIGLDGSVNIDKNSKEIIFNGTDINFATKSGTTINNVFYSKVFEEILQARGNYVEVKIYSNYFKSTWADNMYLYNVEGICVNNSKQIGAGFGLDSEITTVALANAWLQEQYANGTPLRVLAPLLKADTINLPSIEPIKLFEGTNNFELVTNLDTTLNMTYNHVGYSPSIVKPSEVKGVGSEEHINMVDVQVVSNKTYTNVIETNPNYIIVEQTSATKLSNIRSNALELKAGVTYTVRRKFEVLSDYSDKDTGNVEIYLGEKWKKVILYPDVEVATFTVDEDGTYYLMHKLAQTNVATATIPIRMKIYDVMVCEGKDKPYTPYGYCRYENVVENKNIFNKEKNYGIGPYYYDNKTKLVSIRTNSSTYTNYRTYNLKLKPNTTYSATLKNLPFNDSNDLHRIMLTNNNDILQKIVVDNQYVPKGIEQIYTFNTGTENLKLWLQTTADIDVVEKIQLEIGEPTEYIEHQTQTLPIDIPVGQEWYSGKPYKVNGKWYRDVEWKKEEILTVNSVTSVYTNTARFKTYVPAKYVRGVNPYCNYLIGDNTLAGQDIENVGIHNAGYVQLTLPKELFGETIISANTKLQELKDNGNPLYVVYPLTEPTREEITDPVLISQLEALQNAEFYDGVTNINSYRPTEDVAEMSLELHYNFITPSPSVERPSEVKSVGSEEEINKIGKATLRTTGKGVELTNNEDGSFTLNGTSTDSVWVDFETNIKNGGDYKVSFNKNRNISSFGGDVRLCIYNGETKLNDTTLINKTNYNVTFENGNLPTHAGVWLNKGNTFDNFTFYPSITKGTEDLSFTPYGYCRYETKVENRNRFNIHDIPFYNTGANKSVIDNGMRITATKDGTWLGALFNLGEITRYKGKTIRVKAISKTSANNTPFIGIGLCDKYGNNRKSLASNNYIGEMGVSLLINPTENQTHAYMSINANGAGTCYVGDYIDYTNIIITIDDTDTSYIEHQEQLFPIDLPIGMKMYNDEFFYKENGKWWRSINYVKSKLTSDMEWYLEVFDGIGRPRTDDFANIIKNVSAVNTVRVYSNYFKQNYGRTDYVFGNLKVGYLGFYTNKQLYLTTYFKNVNDWKTYLDQNDVYIVFEIEPYPEEITDANLIAQLEKTLTPFSYYPVTNINSYKPTTSVADLKLYVEYFKSNKITNK